MDNIRYSAIKRLHRKQYHNEKVKIELITVPTFTDVLHNYKLINKNTPLPEWSPNIDENIPKQVFASLMNEYPNIWKKAKNQSDHTLITMIFKKHYLT